MEKYFSLISLNQDSVTVVTIQPSPLSSDDFVTAHAFTTLISVHVVFSLSNFSQIVIDSCCCATFAEYQKRGKDFWSEFEVYLADLLVGVVVDVALVGWEYKLLVILVICCSSDLLCTVMHLLDAGQMLMLFVLDSVFEAERPGCKFSVKQWVATYFYKKPGKEKEQGTRATALEAGQTRPNQNRANQPRKANRNNTTKPTVETPTTPENQKCSGIMDEMK
ncbi:hypothetical protein EZV62_008970 [Acer yangbiense]|uniref:Uncharacterized protein n=1 Tax=Acer yangbiense TaxID=1000413 RepID=A0A5C7IFB4_9ROSI|nr:hypothetical protein EZV62_008970 [Acer yangbiense]